MWKLFKNSFTEMSTYYAALYYTHTLGWWKLFDLKSSWIGRRRNRHYSLWPTESGITVFFDRAYRGWWRMVDRGVLYRTSSRNSYGTVSFGKFFIPVMTKSHTQSADLVKYDRSHYNLRVLYDELHMWQRYYYFQPIKPVVVISESAITNF